MKAMIVGGDRIDTARRALLASGYGDIVHWSGRKPADLTRPLPAGVAHMVIMLDFINHNLARRMKDLARERQISVAYVGRKRQGEPDAAAGRRGCAKPLQAS
ncbi:DUF2325 domain-containing protein [Vogesella sp. GCM10023246]|uniref:Dihydroorotate dehydrogenase n=1 Tax=Vogesella oryzagri TaxID=3160864 RepID=A0ABV1M3M5_9NEIS